MKRQEQDAWAAAMDSLDGEANGVSRGGGARGKLQALRKSVRSQFGEAAGGLRQLKQNIQSKRPRAALSSLLSLLPAGRRGRGQQRQEEENSGLGSFAERLLRRFQREGVGKYGKYKGEGAGGMEDDGSNSFAGIDARYLPLLQSLEEEGHRALGNEEWHPVSDKEDTKVWRRLLAEGSYGKEYPCLKLSTVVDAPAEVVMELLLDSGRVGEYNKYSKGRTDVEQLGPNTKIVRNRTLPPLQKKTHEFCTLMHVIKRPDGSQVMLTKYTDHPDVPHSDSYARSEIILGVTEVRPHPTDPNRAQFTTVSHVKSAGVPSFLAEKFSARGLTDFAESLRKALHLHVGREGREVEERKREKRERELQQQQQQREEMVVEVQAV